MCAGMSAAGVMSVSGGVSAVVAPAQRRVQKTRTALLDSALVACVSLGCVSLPCVIAFLALASLPEPC